MKNGIAGITKASAAFGAVVGVIAVAALPAVAATPNRAFGAAAAGFISAPPLGLATYPGSSPVTVVRGKVAGLIATRIITDAAGPVSADSAVAALAARLSVLARLRATAISSRCSFNTNTGAVSGAVTITRGVVRIAGRPLIRLAAQPAANTRVSVPGAAAITLYKRSTGADGTLTVTAIYVSQRRGTQALSLGTSVCNAANLNPVPVLPGQALALTLGGMGAVLVVGVGHQLIRRRRATGTRTGWA